MKRRSPGLFLAAAMLMLAGCAKTPPCVVCYEDAWSREPFPGQPKQHIAPLTPEDVSSSLPGAVKPSTREFLGISANDNTHPF